MKPILKPSRTIPLSIKLILLLVLLLIGLSFILSIKYFNESKREYVTLVFDSHLSAPQCSDSAGFYVTPFELKLTTTSKSCKIYFTIDGTEPTLKSSVFAKPIIIKDRTEELNNLSNIPTSPRWKPPLGNVFKGTVLRAIVVTEDNRKSAELIKTFFVDPKGTNRYSFPVISLTVNPDDLFGYKNGIYVLGKNYDDKRDYIKKNVTLTIPWWDYPSNYLKRGDNAERPIHIEFFEPNNKKGFDTDATVRINGNGTRGFAQKSLRISFENKQGSNMLNYQLFSDGTITSFSSIILRNSGNDWNKTMFRDLFMQSIMENSNIKTHLYRPAIVFINGEYWGIHDICDRFDENYLANKYKAPVDNFVILEQSGDLFYGKKSDEMNFKNLLSYIQKNDMSIISNYLQVSNQIEITSFIDFIIANIYFCNSDWPDNNVRFWRYKRKQSGNDSTNAKDGRWRWMLCDTDWGFGYTSKTGYEINLLDKAKSTGSVGIIFTGLLKNKMFLDKFILRYRHFLNNEFETKGILKRIDKIKNTFMPEMEEHINRWRVIGSFSEWEENTQLLKEFGSKRPTIQAKQLNEYFHLNGNDKIIIEN